MEKHLLQRLLPPSDINVFDNTNQLVGLSKSAIKSLQKICNFDNMGNAQYEFGIIPGSLSHIYLSRSKYKLINKYVNGIEFIFLIDYNKLNSYSKKIESWMSSNFDAHNEYHGLNDLKNGKELENKIIGWFDLNDNVLFFINSDEGLKMSAELDDFLNPNEY